MRKRILVTGASSGFGRLAAQALAAAGHTVYASMRDTAGRNAGVVHEMADLAGKQQLALHTVELDVQSQASADAAVASIVAQAGGLDVVVHNAGHMVFGPAEAFTAEQLAQVYDINVLGTQRVNRAALPHLRAQQQGLLVWVSSSSSAGGTPPYLGPYFAAKAAMDALAVQYARELARWGVETSIIVPAPSPGAPTTLPMPVRPTIPRAPLRTRPARMRALANRCSRHLRAWCPKTPTWPRWRRRSCRW